jgi:hypothetical protein
MPDQSFCSESVSAERIWRARSTVSDDGLELRNE